MNQLCWCLEWIQVNQKINYYKQEHGTWTKEFKDRRESDTFRFSGFTLSCLLVGNQALRAAWEPMPIQASFSLPFFPLLFFPISFFTTSFSGEPSKRGEAVPALAFIPVGEKCLYQGQLPAASVWVCLHTIQYLGLELKREVRTNRYLEVR